ncbi:hypothetical protein, unknown function [Leishmania tarentolae]|uniref:Uncharacterized protein n=1 Tax=Leishmania tarentolae TaxID=5689 RepID=A0A640KRQ0_LEITA|nr:hypothetical protein, unknown function [Leishmania tarentolae]
MISTHTFLQLLDVPRCCFTEEPASCYRMMTLTGVEGATVTQISEELLRWLPSKVSENLRHELFLDDSARRASLRRYPASSTKRKSLKSGVAVRNTTSEALASQQDSVLAGPGEDDYLHIQMAASRAALAVLSVALRPLVQDPNPALGAASDSPETSAVCQVERVCALLLRLVTSHLDGCHGARAAHEPILPPSLISASTVRPHVAASLRKWLQYFLLFFMDWLHLLQSSIPSASRISPRQRRAATSASRHRRTKPTADAVRDDDVRELQRGLATRLSDPLRSCPADLVRHPLHYYALALQRASLIIESGCDAKPKCGSEGDEEDLRVTSQLCAQHHKSDSHTLPSRSAGKRRGSLLGKRGVARRRCGESSSTSSSSSTSTSTSTSSSSATCSPTESPPLFYAFLPQRRRKAPIKGLPKRHALGCTDAPVDGDVLLVDLPNAYACVR